VSIFYSLNLTVRFEDTTETLVFVAEVDGRPIHAI